MTKSYLSERIILLSIVNYKGITMRVVLCTDDTCVPPKCPTVDVEGNTVTIGEDNNICTLTKDQFDILKEKIKNGEI
jgi:hypothetical protein